MQHPETIEIIVNGEKIIINKDDLPLWQDKIDADEKPKRKPRKKEDAE